MAIFVLDLWSPRFSKVTEWLYQRWIKQEENGKHVSSDFQMADVGDLFLEKNKHREIFVRVVDIFSYFSYYCLESPLHKRRIEMFIELLVVKEGKQIESSLKSAHPSIALNSNQIPYLYFTYM